MMDTIYMGSRAVPGFALSQSQAPSDPYGPASIHYSQLLAKVYQAKTLIKRGTYAQAIQSLQAIGNEAASGLGPQIDQGPQPAVTQPLTGHAWTVNDQLSKIGSAGANDAKNAADAIDTMMADYSTAINKAHAAMGIAPDTQQPAAWPYVTFAGAVLIAGGTALYLVFRR